MAEDTVILLQIGLFNKLSVFSMHNVM